MWIWVFFLASLIFTTTFQQELTALEGHTIQYGITGYMIQANMRIMGMWLISYRAPSAPSQVTAVTTGCHSMQVRWKPVALNGTMLDMYEVSYSEENSTNSTMMVTVNGSQTELEKLNRLTLYKIRVAAIVNSKIVGTKSSEIHNTTFGAVKPTSLRVNSVTNHSAILSWNIDRPNIGCNGKEINAQFRVRYRQTNEAPQRINVAKTSVELADLLPFTNYSVFVINIDPSGQNHRSDDFFFTSLPGVPSAPINITTVTAPTQLLINWQEPLMLNGIVSHYDVEYSEQGLSPQVTTTSDTELLLAGLNPSAVYVVRVRANNYAKLDLNGSDVIPGLFTNVTTVRLPDPLPVPPGHPRDFKVTHSVFYGTSIQLEFSWKPPSTGDPVDSYWIRCNKSNGPDPIIIRITLPTLPLIARINADPFTTYHCYSYASNDMGNGPFSRTVSIPPIPLASSPVLQLSAVPLNYSHMQLSWNKPRYRSDHIDLYRVILRNPVANTTINFIVDAPNTSLVVQALTGDTMYSFDVVAITMFNGEYLNSNVTSRTITTQTGTPSSPRDVAVKTINQATVLVQWSPPMPTNGIIIGYRVDTEVSAVYDTENGGRDFIANDSASVQDLHYTMPLLTPGANYTFNITAFTTEGPGPTTSVRHTLNNGRTDAITYFQLKLRPFTDCSKSEDTTTKQDIRRQLVQGLEAECACVLDPNVTITDIQTQCIHNDDDSHLIYIGRIIGTEALRPLILFDLLESWTSQNALVFEDRTLMIDQTCPLHLSSPKDHKCEPKQNPTTSTPNPTPSVVIEPPTSSSSVPSVPRQSPSVNEPESSPVLSVPPQSPSVNEPEDKSDDKSSLLILVACFVGGVLLGCLITLFILMIVFCCHIRKRRKQNIEEAIYSRPSRKNKRIKVTANGNKNHINMQACPPYSVDNDGKEGDYAIPKNRTGSIDSVDLQLYRTESKVRAVHNPIPYTPTHTAPCTPPIPPTFDRDSPVGLYSSPTKQAMSLDNLSSYTNSHANGKNESLYQSPRYPSLSVDDLLNGVPSRKFPYHFSPLHSSTKSPKPLPKIPQDAYDDPRTLSKALPNGDITYDTPKRYVSRPLPINDVRQSPRSAPRTPKDAYDDPRKPSTLSADNPTYDSPRNVYDPKESAGTPTHPLLVDELSTPLQTLAEVPENTYDDPRRPSGVSVNNTTYNSPRNPYKYTQIATSTKPVLVDDKDDPDYSYVE